MTPADFLTNTMRPAAAWLTQLTGIPCDDRYLCQSLATALVETGLLTREQEPVDYASGYWQMQRGTCQLLLDHAECGPLFESVCHDLGIEPTADAIFAALRTVDRLGFAGNRLLNWADPDPMPEIGDIEAGWRCYLNVQRPGRPSESRWRVVYPQAVACFTTPA